LCAYECELETLSERCQTYTYALGGRKRQFSASKTERAQQPRHLITLSKFVQQQVDHTTSFLMDRSTNGSEETTQRRDHMHESSLSKPLKYLYSNEVHLENLATRSLSPFSCDQRTKLETKPQALYTQPCAMESIGAPALSINNMVSTPMGRTFIIQNFPAARRQF
jgi:hypothetical protein